MSVTDHIPYAHEQMSQAVRDLACFSTSIQDRLHTAYIHRILHLKPEEMPTEEMSDLATDLQENLDKDSLKDMSDEDASDWATKLLTFTTL